MSGTIRPSSGAASRRRQLGLEQGLGVEPRGLRAFGENVAGGEAREGGVVQRPEAAPANQEVVIEPVVATVPPCGGIKPGDFGRMRRMISVGAKINSDLFSGR